VELNYHNVVFAQKILKTPLVARCADAGNVRVTGSFIPNEIHTSWKLKRAFSTLLST